MLPIPQRRVENALVEAGAPPNPRAPPRRAKTRKLAAGSEHAAEADELIADLRETHRRRPRLQQEFDRAGLPRDALDAGIAEDLRSWRHTFAVVKDVPSLLQNTSHQLSGRA